MRDCYQVQFEKSTFCPRTLAGAKLAGKAFVKRADRLRRYRSAITIKNKKGKIALFCYMELKGRKKIPRCSPARAPKKRKKR